MQKVISPTPTKELPLFSSESGATLNIHVADRFNVFSSSVFYDGVLLSMPSGFSDSSLLIPCINMTCDCIAKPILSIYHRSLVKFLMLALQGRRSLQSTIQLSA